MHVIGFKIVCVSIFGVRAGVRLLRRFLFYRSYIKCDIFFLDLLQRSEETVLALEKSMFAIVSL
jgi:hypothetical protein